MAGGLCNWTLENMGKESAVHASLGRVKKYLHTRETERERERDLHLCDKKIERYVECYPLTEFASSSFLCFSRDE